MRGFIVPPKRFAHPLPADARTVRGASSGAIHAACVYIACRQEGIERTFREVCGCAAGTTVKEIGRSYKAIIAVLSDVHADMGKIPVESEHMISRIVANLALPAEFARAGRAITQAAKQYTTVEVVGLPNEARTPGSIAATAMWLALNMHGGAPSTRADLSRVSSFSESYFTAMAKWLFPYVRELTAACPADFKRPDALAAIEKEYPLPNPADSMCGLARACAKDKAIPLPSPQARAEIADAACVIITKLYSVDAATKKSWAGENGIVMTAAVFPRSLAAAAVWLAARLRGVDAPMRAVMTAAGVVAEAEFRAAARVLAQKPAAFASQLQPQFRAAASLEAFTRDAPRMLWTGGCEALAAACVECLGASRSAPLLLEPAPPPGAAPPRPRAAVGAPPPDGAIARADAPAAASALAAAIAALRPAMQQPPPLLPADATSAVGAATAAVLLSRMAGDAPAVSPREAAAASCVDEPLLRASLGAFLPHARALAAQLPRDVAAVFVSEAALCAIEDEFPPPPAALPPPAADVGEPPEEAVWMQDPTDL